MVASELSQAARAEKSAPHPSQNAEPQEPAPKLVNRVGQSKSPYVRSHANGRVAWQLLDDETIERARKENKLIFLHIGFKACHYSRLTSTECFTHRDCANILNESFIPVIVDREEHPELDTIYMNYVQAVSGSGGWPLNLFLTSELEPVFGGTYYPAPGPNNGSSDDEERLDFLAILRKLQKVWREQETRCRQEAKEVVVKLHDFAAEGTLGTSGTVPAGVAGSQTATALRSETGLEHPGTGRTAAAVSSELDLDQLEEAYTHIAGTFDPVYGGFGLAPKFPTPPKLSFLLRLPRYLAPVQDVVGETECAHATEMALFTLRKIRDSSLRDHVGGCGFARYSVTADWSVPRFEKLVAQNALLLGLYLDAWLIASSGERDEEFYDVVLELVDYLASAPISLPDGGFVSSEAADSYYRRGDRHMREGAYNLWTRREFDTVIGNDHEAALAASYWNVLEHGNVEPDQDPNDEFMNENILRVVKDMSEIGRQAGITVDEVKQVISSAKRKLKAHRDKERVSPEVDTKVVTGRNGLVISALARAGSALSYVDAARSTAAIEAASKAAAFIKANLWDDQDKILYRIYNEGRGDTKGLAEDYAYLIEGLIDLYEATANEQWIEFADELQKVQIDIFYDSPSIGSSAPEPPRSLCGAFYTTAENAAHTILRLKDGMDTALPSTNAVSVSNLFRLGVMLSDEAYTALARETLNAFEAEILQYPWLFPGLLSGLVAARLGGKTWVVVLNAAGEGHDLTQRLLRKLRAEARGGLRNLLVLRTEDDLLAKRSPALRELVQRQQPGAYHLENGVYRPISAADLA
ncbi:Spermatogenesis-associated protein 20 [Colletotrichum chlorophyti]|uniref:Spermatogenesis-associated protein 20 n=1 Tax=Colletotrichum chlorophyti TaxID=708187 RepID=A0A1Q8S5B1_9PEZI|nr:Spermatogenesis-associated protein 20 [Colletotrichum chlorophyti]